jgi:hypothetical protein
MFFETPPALPHCSRLHDITGIKILSEITALPTTSESPGGFPRSHAITFTIVVRMTVWSAFDVPKS